MTRWTLIAGLSSVLLCGSTAMAARCSGVAGIVFCDDFDRWCQDPPVDPAAQCLVTDPEDEPAFWGHWPQADGTCSVNSPYRLWTAGDAVYYKYASVKAAQNPDTQRLARHVHDMTTEIEENPLNTEVLGALNGLGEILSSTDPSYVDPDTIPGTLKGHTYIWNGSLCGGYSNFTYYTELNLDGDRAPTNFTWRNCYEETGDHGGSPHQLMQATDVNPNPVTTWHHASFAFGLVAHFDEEDGNPCNIGTGRKPTAWRAFVYDGANWTRLKADAFDLPLPDDADFYPWKRWNRLRFWIGTDHIEIRLYNPRAEALYASEGRCGVQDCVTNKCTGGLDHGQACVSDASCRPSQGTCDTGLCVGGTNDGGACTQACPEGLCNEQGICEGGANDGQACDCPAAPPTIAQPYFVARVPRAYKGPFNTIALGAGQGVDQMTPLCEQIRSGGVTKCVGGINNGNTCTTVADCPPSVGICDTGFCDGGTNDGGACTQTCPDGVCNAQGLCDGGANAGEPCDCPALEECLKPVSNAGNNMALDEVILWDGIFEDGPDRVGACCQPSLECVVTDRDTCEITLGGRYDGHFSQCGDVLCCGTPFADSDADDDVDQDDFGKFQACFTGTTGSATLECECFDTDDDGNVDEDDWGVFEGCASGPDVPADPSCDSPPT